MTADDLCAGTPGSSPETPALLPQHQRLIEGSAISPDVAAERGYRSITTKVELESVGFSKQQCRAPGLLVPIWNVHGTVALHQFRPDEPRLLNGKEIKYETPKGARMVIDVPPRVRAMLADPKVPLFITEGVRKADSAVSKGLCCISLLGVWNWRGTNARGGRTALPDWDLIALNGRRTYVAFDSDVMTKPAVRSALVRLKAFLESRG